ncbi:Sugar phosphate isomerase/epimerase [Acetomicrobium thermoterrenum DSM 13490]|uniref:Sugar phosphate isomerase/epimerase n=1 Tax=Acetomicrobium thermoterrenum DSM 13490 TaxID=1120987 RepID=A0A1H3HG54_9BACT|nr:5-keto-L-gluconate epimerase [Acetomicrobium thermoterrenum]SDY14442.1 Sugar phosphate isomerase/epimerase [Acetomicrobium thermoterrenum DSM 13490]
MKFSFVISLQNTKFNAIALKENLQQNLEKLKKLSYDGVELAIRDPSTVDIDEMNALLNKNNFTVCAIGTGQAFVEDGLSLTHPDPNIRAYAINRIKKFINLASNITGKPKIIIGLIRGIKKTNVNVENYFYKSMQDILLEAEKYKIDILIEPINRYETDFINNIHEALIFIKKLNHPRLLLLADTFHMNIEEPNVWQSLEICKEKLGHIHVADTNRWAPGYGHFEWDIFSQTLKKISYSGWISGEMLPKPSEDEAISHTITLLRSLFS